jgi:hypothetical protein
MHCTYEDDRTTEQKNALTRAVVGRDRCLSGWGGARGGYSRAAWAFAPDDPDASRIERWVRERGDMQYVSGVDLRRYRPPRGTAHVHVYVVDADHPARRA